MTRYCSLPQFGNIRKWFEKNFHNCCEYHDALYSKARHTRLRCDFALISRMIGAVREKTFKSKILIYYPIIFLTFVLVRAVGWVYYGKGE